MSAQPKFTPGPWSTRPGNSWIVQTPDGIEVCRAPDQCDNDAGTRWVVRENFRANARLIAAAPELYNALAVLLEMHVAHHNAPEHAFARAALAKAVRP